jgi:hypothetical protein
MDKDMLTGWIELGMLGLMVLGILVVFVNRSLVKTERGQHVGYNTRSIQILAVMFVFPVSVLLAFAGKLESGAVAALLGTIVGYVLSGLGSGAPSTDTSQR